MLSAKIPTPSWEKEEAVSRNVLDYARTIKKHVLCKFSYGENNMPTSATNFASADNAFSFVNVHILQQNSFLTCEEHSVAKSPKPYGFVRKYLSSGKKSRKKTFSLGLFHQMDSSLRSSPYVAVKLTAFVNCHIKSSPHSFITVPYLLCTGRRMKRG